MKSATSVILLKQVTDAVTCGQQVHRIVHCDVGREHHDRRVRELLPDQPGGVESLAGVGRWHADVGDHEVRSHGPHQSDQLLTVAGLADNFESGALQQARQALA